MGDFTEADRSQLDIAYSELMNTLAAFPHDDECAYRCLNPDCHTGHGCGVCDEDEEDEPGHAFCWMLNCGNAPLPNKMGCEQHPSTKDKGEDIDDEEDAIPDRRNQHAQAVHAG